jgi:glutathione S-transferase
MAKYKLHCFGQSGNAYKVAAYLNAAGLDWEPVFVDFMNGATRKPEWRAATNVMGEAPVLDVNGRLMTQSGAILTWLADTTGKFAPANADDRYEALRWVLFDNHKFTSYLATYRFNRAFVPKPDAAVVEFFRARFDSALKILDQHLTGRDFVVGKTPTYADYSLAGYLFYPVEETGFDFASLKGVGPWRARLQAMPGFKGPYDCMPGPRIPALPWPR